MMDISEPVILTPAERADLSEICRLCRTVARENPSSKWDSHYPDSKILSGDIRSRTLYKVTENHRIISIVQIRPWEDFMRNEEVKDVSMWDLSIQHPCALGRFCVSPFLQGKGWGRRVFEEALRKADSMGYDGARFHVVEGNRAALHLYDSMGIRYTGDIDEYGIHFLCYEIKF